ncbi:MAG: glycosyltransferase family 4 protein [bacterium]|nr:glycosyltransferase family 4 protein [bacterium]
MKILYIITKSNWGGAQKHVFDLAVHSKKIGHEAVVALGGEGLLRDRLREAGVTTRPIGSLARDMNVLKDGASLADIIKVIRDVRPDILHLHSPKAAGLGSLAARILKVKKIIYTVHGWTFNEDRPWYQKTAIYFFSWLTMFFCTHVIVLSEKELDQARPFPYVSKKLHLIPLGISPTTFFGTSSARLFLQSVIAESLEKRIVVGTIAELHPNKGLIYAISAIEKLVNYFPSIIFFIIGEGDQRKYLENLIKEKSLEKHIVLAGYVKDAAEYLKGFSIFILPSVKEGLPYCVIEAGYAGLPVIATTVGGIPEIIDDMKSGILIQPKKSEEIAHALEFLLNHKNVQKEYGSALRQKVTEKFSLETMLDSTMKIYSEAKPR